MLDATLERYLEANTRQCCHCGGIGRVTELRRGRSPWPPEMPTYDADSDTFVAHYVTPARVCSVCDGSGIDRLSPTSIEACHMVATMTFQIVLSARSESRFGDMNEALDWYEVYRARLIERCARDNPEELEAAMRAGAEIFQKMASVPEDHCRIRLASGAFTEDELADLLKQGALTQDELDNLTKEGP